MFNAPWLRNLLFACGSGLMALAMADSALQPLDDLQSTVQAFLATQHSQRAEPPQIRLQPLDPRLRLPRCRAAPEAFLPGGAKTVGSTSIGVRCPNPPWTIYQRVTIYVYDRVLVASHFLRRGMVLEAADLRAERRELSALSGGYEIDPARLVGKQLQQALMVGMVISPRAVKMPPAVSQGEMITLVVRAGSMEVTSSGIALGSAGIGERVRARNESSGRVVEGRVTGPRRVEVDR